MRSSCQLFSRSRLKVYTKERIKEIREHLDWVGKRLGIQTQEDWYSVTIKDVDIAGGVEILRQPFNNSLSTALQQVYPEFEWNPLLFHYIPRGFYKQHQNNEEDDETHAKTSPNIHHRRFFDWIAEALDIQTQEDWYNVSTAELNHWGAQTLVATYGSVFSTLCNLYPEFEWNALLFKHLPKNHWKDWKNQRKFMDWVSEQLEVKTQLEWYEVTPSRIAPYGVNSLLKEHHNRSMFSLLSTCYPEFEWDPLLCGSVPRHHWSDVRNQRKYMDRVGEALGVEKQEDWYNLNVKSVRAFGVLRHYKSSLVQSLKHLYPEFDWNWKRSRYQRRTKVIENHSSSSTTTLQPIPYSPTSYNTTETHHSIQQCSN